MGQNVPVTGLEPALALASCETALRELMASSYTQAYGVGWLNRVATEDRLAAWEARAQEERQARGPKGVLAVPNTGLSYANFYDLVAIAEKHWEPLAPALGKRASMLPLLKRLENLRNAVGHNRPLLQFERDLMAGIAGQIRNQVTIYMSARDEVGDIYPRIESIMDSFGRRVESSQVTGEIAGSVNTHDVVVHPGDIVTFECQGVDPQDRDVSWKLVRWGRSPGEVVGQSGHPVTLRWEFSDDDVTETFTLEIFMSAHNARYHRFGSFDHRAYFAYRVRPPRNIA